MDTQPLTLAVSLPPNDYHCTLKVDSVKPTSPTASTFTGPTCTSTIDTNGQTPLMWMTGSASAYEVFSSAHSR